MLEVADKITHPDPGAWWCVHAALTLGGVAAASACRAARWPALGLACAWTVAVALWVVLFSQVEVGDPIGWQFAEEMGPGYFPLIMGAAALPSLGVLGACLVLRRAQR